MVPSIWSLKYTNQHSTGFCLFNLKTTIPTYRKKQEYDKDHINFHMLLKWTHRIIDHKFEFHWREIN